MWWVNGWVGSGLAQARNVPHTHPPAAPPPPPPTQAYSPLAKARKLEDPTITAIAQRLGVTPAQVLIR